MERYFDRKSAGLILAKLLKKYARQPETIVLGLPRGGVPVAYEIAQKLSLPLDVFIVRKIGAPNQPELAMGAIASGDVAFYNQKLMQSLQVSKNDLISIVEAEREELKRREQLYRGDRPELKLQNKTIILVDDGIATGATVHAAIKSIRLQHPASIIVAAPVAAKDTCEVLAQEVDEFICPMRPEPFGAVGYWYDQFPQTSDTEVMELLEHHLT